MKVRTLVVVLLAVTFGYAGSAKLIDPVGISQAIASLGWIPRAIINPLALTIPTFETLCAFAILTNSAGQRRVGALGMALLLAIFTAVWIVAVWTDNPFSCSCFGSDSIFDFGGAAGAVVRNVLLLAAALWLYVDTCRSKSEALSTATRTQSSPSA